MAILMAMLTLALVATLAAGVLWKQFRTQELESFSRTEQQANLLLGAALDWARIILSEDAKASSIDHKSEPWSIALKETQLSSFLANGAGDASTTSNPSTLGDSDQSSDADVVAERIYLSGRITDLQGRLNLFNLTNLTSSSNTGTVSTPDLAALTKLFVILGLPKGDLNLLVQGLSGSGSAGVQSTPLVIGPQHIEQLSWLGLSAQTIGSLSPYVTWLPQRTALNLNTASAQVLAAVFPGLSLESAQKVAQSRDIQPWSTLDAAASALNSGMQAGSSMANPSIGSLNSAQFALNSNYFLVFGQIRFDHLIFTERSVLQRNNQQTNILWREKRAVGAEPGCFFTIESPC
jgi:general secretion pathway protein K